MIRACAVCGHTINADMDLDADVQRHFELHLQACALGAAVEKNVLLERIAKALEGVVEFEAAR